MSVTRTGTVTVTGRYTVTGRVGIHSLVVPGRIRVHALFAKMRSARKLDMVMTTTGIGPRRAPAMPESTDPN